MYAKISGNTVIKYPYTVGELRKDNSNTSFPRQINASTMKKFGMVGVLRTPKPEHGEFEVAVEGTPELIDGQWFQTWTVRDMFSDIVEEVQKRVEDAEGNPILDSEGEEQFYEVMETVKTKAEQEAEVLAARTREQERSVRDLRDAELASTDWAALSDVVMSPEMAVYRQALRDVTAQEGFPHTIEWPVKPE